MVRVQSFEETLGQFFSVSAAVNSYCLLLLGIPNETSPYIYSALVI